jgi:hypothetical protein
MLKIRKTNTKRPKRPLTATKTCAPNADPVTISSRLIHAVTLATAALNAVTQ